MQPDPSRPSRSLDQRRPPLAIPQSYGSIRSRLGLDPDEAARPYARFFNPVVAPIQPQAAEALQHGAVPHAQFTPFAEYAGEFARPGYLPVETGWTLFPDGVMGVAVLTRMPGVRAEMWDWWFGWHSIQSARYRLWHPGSHMAAQYADDQPETDYYVGRTSLVHELIGGMDLHIAIRFADPATAGFPAGSFDGTLIHGWGSSIHDEIEAGCFMHQVRNTADGCEMRSRFYRNLRLEFDGGAVGAPPPEVMVQKRGPGMLAHCAEEMNHLAQFLPALYAAFAG